MLATSILTVSYLSGNSRARLVHTQTDSRTVRLRGRDFAMSASGQAHAEAGKFAAEREQREDIEGLDSIPVWMLGMPIEQD